ncbi:MAG: hypothetical protein M3083_13135 [Actinomycetota bacterium]|nr:hypothetical protein [Actinomycetota bacterium]MDQ6949136.1 hypothetical protein [Actinomycetota bacterium]
MSPDAAALSRANAKVERLEGELAKHRLALVELLAESATDNTKPEL